MFKEKALGDAAWKDLAARNKVKDNGLAKALEKLKRVGEDSPEEASRALDDVDKLATALKKDKAVAAAAPVGKLLAEMLDAVAAARRDLAKAKAEQEKAQKAKAEAEKKAAADAARRSDGNDDDDEESPEQLTSKVRQLLKLVAKGETVHALLGKSGKQVVVMLSRKPIPPARRKMLADELGGGSTKYYPGTCSLEAGSTTFHLKSEVAGMSKLVKAALLQQTGLRLNKIKCRGEDGDDQDDDETAGASAAAPLAAGGGAAVAAPGDGHADAAFARLLDGARKLSARLELVRYRLKDQIEINEKQWAVAAASKAAGTIGRLFGSAAHAVGHAVSDDIAEQEFHAVTTPDDDIYDAAEDQFVRFHAAVAKHDLRAAGEALKAYAAEIERAAARVDDFLKGVGSGAEGATTVLQGTAVAGAVAATVATGGVASGAAVPMLGIAASGGASLLGTAAAVGVGAGVYGAAQEGAGQVSERVIGTRSEIDFGQIALRGAKDAAIGFVGAFVGGALAKQFAKMFGSYLSQAITAEELAAIGKITNNGVPLARDAFLSTGQRLVTDFLAGAGTTPLTTAIGIVAERFSGKPAPTTEQFMDLVLKEFIQGSALQVFIGALTHGAGGRGSTPEPEPAVRPAADESTLAGSLEAGHAANDNVELPMPPAASDNVPIDAAHAAEVPQADVIPLHRAEIQSEAPLRKAAGAEGMSQQIEQGSFGGGRTRRSAPEITARPKSGSTLPEGYGDALEMEGMNIRDSAGGGKPSDKTTAGNFYHRWAEIFEDLLKKKQVHFEDVVPKGSLSSGLEAEVEVPHPDYPPGRRPRIDRLDRAAGEIIEIGPDSQSAQKQAEAQQYAEWMDRFEPLPSGGKWKWRVVLYDQKRVLAFLKSIGYLE